MKKIYPIFLLLFILGAIFSSPVSAQNNVLDPDDPVVNYNSDNPPTAPPYGTIGKWVRTPRMSWNTSAWKAYYYKGMAFRILFPKSYKTDSTKKFPLLLFFHGEGEKGTVYDNELQLANCGSKLTTSVQNGTFDGFVVFPQSPYGGWAADQFTVVNEFINYMVLNVRADKFRIIVSGLSSGGDGTWRFADTYPKLVAAATPISATTATEKDPNFIDTIQDIPIWLSQGGQDKNPLPSFSADVVQGLVAAGMDIRTVQPGGTQYGPASEGFYIVYPNNAHNTWDAHYNEPQAFSYILRAYKSNPHVYFGKREFCPGTPINAKLELTPGFTGYQWSKNGVIISGATTNSITVTDTGTYAARIIDGADTSDWSHWPAEITYKGVTHTPDIIVSGLMSKVLPAPDGSTTVNLALPPGYASYEWRNASGQVLGNGPIYTGAQPGKYIATTTEINGCSSLPSDTFTVASTNGPNPPDPATDLSGYALSQTSIQLNWSNNLHPTFNETAFEVYRATTSGGPYQFAGIVPADTLGFIDAGLNANTKYFYIVRAIDSTGAAPVSAEDSIITLVDNVAPTAPSNLVVTGTTTTSVTLNWNASTDNASVKNYYVYINGRRTYLTTDTTFTAYNLTHGQSYAFTVKAVDPTGNLSASSNQVVAFAVDQGLNYEYYTYTGTWQSMPNLSTLTPVLEGNVPNVTLAPATQQNNYAFSYDGKINIRQAGTYTFYISSDDGSKLYINDSLLVNNDGLHGTVEKSANYTFQQAGMYSFHVDYYQGGGSAVLTTSWKSDGLGIAKSQIPDSAFIENTTLGGNPPAVPGAIVATAVSYNKVNIHWTDSSSNESGFEVYRSTVAGGPWQIIGTTGSNVTTFIDSTVSPSSIYYYQVQAINQYGESGFSTTGGLNYSYYELPTSPSTMPDFSTLTPVEQGNIPNITLDIRHRNNNFALTFAGMINIPVSGNYTFYTTSDDGSLLYIDGFDTAHIVVNNNKSQAATERSGNINLTAGRHPIYISYFQGTGGYVLTASYMGPGISKSLIPDTALAAPGSYAITFPLPSVPKAPGALNATTDGNNVVKLTWADSSDNETGFNVYRSDGDNLHYRQLKQLPTNTVSYTDDGLYANTTYYYKVEAVNIGGSSGFSNEVNVNTSQGQSGTAQAVYINFNGASYSAGGYWNNTNDSDPRLGDIFSNMKDTLGITTNIGLKILSNGLLLANTGESTGNNSGIYPDNVLVSSYYVTGNISDSIQVFGLNPGDFYSFTFLGSSIRSPRYCMYQIGQQKMLLNTYNNTTNSVSINNVKADQGGRITIIISANGVSSYGSINALVIRGGFTSVAKDLKASYTNGAVVLNWKNMDDQKTNLGIFRKSKLSDYTLIGVVGPDDTQFHDSTIAPLMEYSYKIGAFYSSGDTIFSNAVQITIPNMGVSTDTSSIYINFNDGSYAQGGYWNNTNDSSPRLGDIFPSMKDSLGNITGIGMKLLSNGLLPANTGKSTGNNSGIYPDNVLVSSYYVTGSISDSVQIFGLNPGDFYSFTFLGSSIRSPRSCTYQIGQQSVLLNTYDNTTNSVSINNVKADQGGTINIVISAKGVSSYGSINAMVIRQVTLFPSTPTSVQLENIYDREKYKLGLSWQVQSKNADSILVYRSIRKDSTYTLLNLGQSNGKETSYVDSTVKNNITYYYYLVAANGNGRSNPSDTLSTLSLPPVINMEDSLDINQGDNTTIPISVSTASGNTITITASGLPSFAALTDSGNATGSISLHPGEDVEGNFSFNITATDKNGLSSTKKVNIRVINPNSAVVYVNFGLLVVSAPWNNSSVGAPRAGGTMSNLKTDDGVNSGINLTFQENWSGSNTSGSVTGNNTGVYPDSVMKSSYWDQSGTVKHIILSGLSSANKYTLNLFASRSGSGSNRVVFTVGGIMDSLEANNNTNSTVQFKDVVPDQNNQIIISVFKGSGASFTYLNALVINAHDSSAVLAPINVKASANSPGMISLNWSNPDIVTGTEIWRSTSAGGTYTLIGTVSGNTSTYNDSGLDGDTRYFYRLKAVRNAKESAYSIVASATTILYSMYVNFTNVDVAPLPWYNLNQLPMEGNTFNLEDSNGNNTGVILTDGGGFGGINENGMVTGNNSGVYPDAVLNQSYYTQGTDSGRLSLQGLNINMSYNLTFFASRQGTGDRTTLYFANGQGASLQATNNTLNTVTVPNVMPDENGEINIQVTAGGQSVYGYIGALVIQAHSNYDDSGNVIYNKNAYMLNRLGANEMYTRKLLGQDSTSMATYKVIAAYPNPFNQYVNIKMSCQANDKLILRLFNSSGSLKDVQTLDVSGGINTIRYQPKMDIVPGFYILNISSTASGKTENIKLIKQ